MFRSGASLAIPHRKSFLRYHSSRNKLPFMIRNPQSKLQKNGFSCRKMGFPTEKCIFLQKSSFPAAKCIFLQQNAFFCSKMHFPAEKCGFQAARGRKPQEIAGLQGSRIKNPSQLSLRYHPSPECSLGTRIGA